jgi:hypothetical protein
MRFIIGQRQSTPRGATRGAIAGCGCGGGAKPNPPRFGWKAGMSRGVNPWPQMRYGQRYGVYGTVHAMGFAPREAVRGAKDCWQESSGGGSVRFCCMVQTPSGPVPDCKGITYG